MKIVGNVEVQGYTRVEDLDEGDVFCFCDDDTVYMKAFQGYMIDLANGDIDEYGYEEYRDRPVRILKAHLVIE